MKNDSPLAPKLNRPTIVATAAHLLGLVSPAGRVAEGRVAIDR
jgi:hypothetical protein